MFEVLYHYLPQDRLHALAHGTSLAAYPTGSVLFADIAGFTTLADDLRTTLGSRQGAEVLTAQLDAVYSLLIARVEAYGGSVIGFAGDSITCWFDGSASASHAMACAQELQQVMAHTVAMPASASPSLSLTLKVAIASGPARRLVVGDPAICLFDTLGGETVARMAAGEQLARRGDIILDQATVALLGAALTVAEWRVDLATGEKFAVMDTWEGSTPPLPLPLAPPMLEAATLRPWVQRAVYARERSGQARFLTEFRPTVALFIRFVDTIDDAAGAETNLNDFICQMQAIVDRYDGTLLHITIGDKGSYATIAFGALSTHEDDMRRATKAAMDIRAAALEFRSLAPIQVGLTYGIARVGSYGGPTRRTYSMIGDDVNFAARLMQRALPGEILVSERIQQALARAFLFVAQPAALIKGKALPQMIFVLADNLPQPMMRLQEPRYALPMVGRQRELDTLAACLEHAFHGQRQVVGIMADAGLGKSRLVADAIQIAREQGFAGYGGGCQSDNVISPYSVWKPIWATLLGLDQTMSIPERQAQLERQIAIYAPDRINALPLLGPLLDIPIAESDFTRALEPKVRQSMLHVVLEACLKAAARETPLLLVIEDMHWIDALSATLLDDLARVTSTFPICFLLAYRELPSRINVRLDTLSHFTEITLTELSPSESAQVIQAKLALLYPQTGPSLPTVFGEQLLARAQGNPFYLEELINYLHDRGIDPNDTSAVAQIEIPDSLHALILSRIDQLVEHEKTTLRVASIIGRRFSAAWLSQYYPPLGSPTQITQALNSLRRLDITPQDTPEPELAYLFKHIITHEVAYNSLLYSTRAFLHESIAQFLETQPDESAAFVDSLAYHYGRSANQAKQQEYFLKAGDLARARFANGAALDYYERLIPLLEDPGAQADIHMKCGTVLQIMGRYDEATACYNAALACPTNDARLAARCYTALGHLAQIHGQYASALEHLAQSQHRWDALQDRSGLSQTATELGYVAWRTGDYPTAQRHAEHGLDLARQTADPAEVARALNGLGIVRLSQHDYVAAQASYEESLALRRTLGDLGGIGLTLGNLGIVMRHQGNYQAAQRLNEESLALCQEIGDKPGIASVLNGLSTVAFYQDDYHAARAYCEESLRLFREMNNRWDMAMILNNLGEILEYLGDDMGSRAYHVESLQVRRDLGDQSGIAQSLNNLANLDVRAGVDDHALGFFTESLGIFHTIGNMQGIICNLVQLAGLAARAGTLTRATTLAAAAETLRSSSQVQLEPRDRRMYDETIATLKTDMSEETFSRVWANAQALELNAAIVEAQNLP